MKKIMALALVIGLAIFMLFSASGCKGEKVTEENIEQAIEEAIESEGGEAEVDISEGETTITTDEGEVHIGEGTELPDWFLEVVPMYPGIEILSYFESTANGIQTFSVSALTSDSVDEVFNWFKSQLTGWEIESESTGESDGNEISSISANNGTYSLWISIVESDEGTTVILSVNEMSTGSGGVVQQSEGASSQ